MNMEKFKGEVQEQLHNQEIIYTDFKEINKNLFADVIIKFDNNYKIYNFRYLKITNKFTVEKVYINRKILNQLQK